MDLTFSAEQEAFRAEARAWLAAHVPADPLPSLDTAEGFEAHRAWERTMYEDRWSVVSWPVEYGGRDLGIFEWLVFEEEYYRARAPTRVSQNGIFLLAPTMLEYGTDAQKARFLPPMASGDEIWCQGWSEPDAGSDLAGIRSRASRTRRSHLDPQRPEDVGQPGRVRRVVLRDLPHRPRGGAPPRPDLFPRRHGLAGRDGPPHPPDRRRDRLRRDLLRQRRGARGPDAGRGRRQGWAVAMATAGSERGLSLRSPARYTEAADRLLRLYASRGGPAASADAVARAHMHAEAYQLHTYWTATKVARGQAVGPEASANKIFWSETDVAIHTAALDLLGTEAELLHSGAPGAWLDGYLFSLGGTDLRGDQRDPAQRRGRAPARAAPGLSERDERPAVDFAFSDEQDELRQGVRTVLDAECTPDALRAFALADETGRAELAANRWAVLAELGAPALVVPEGIRRARPERCRSGAACSRRPVTHACPSRCSRPPRWRHRHSPHFSRTPPPLPRSARWSRKTPSSPSAAST